VTNRPAADDLARAEERARVTVHTLTDLSDLEVACRVFDLVWPAADGSSQVPRNLMRALIHAGGYASAAYRDGEPIGAAMGFIGRHRADDGWHAHLHSHMAAVLDPYRDQHIGSALKMHQRMWALEHHLDTIVWTFDPLVRRNARVNLLKLGTDIDGFEVDFYGQMDDGINTGDPTDRLFAWWRLTSPRVTEALAGRLVPVDPAAAPGAALIEVPLPDDIVALRGIDPAGAARWRIVVREQLLAAFGDGYRIIGVSPGGGYVLERQHAAERQT
jgi:predicted GNAT superfamily acetyltransferase